MHTKRKRIVRQFRPLGGIVLLVILLSLLSGFLSCTDERMAETGSPEEDVVFTLRVPLGQQRDESSGVATKAFDTNEVSQALVLVFDRVTDNYLYTALGTVPAGSGTTRTFNTKLGKGNINLVVLCNAHTAFAESFPSGIPSGETRQSVSEKLLSQTAGKWDATSASYTSIPMWGEQENVTISDTNAPLTLSMTRMLAALDVTVASAAQSAFQLQSVHLYNRHTAGRVIPDATLLAAEKPTIPTGKPIVKGPVDYTGSEVTGTGCTGEIYAYEVPAGSEAGHLTNTCLVVGGSYESGTTGYYRIDLSRTSGSTTTYLPLLRNHCYAIEIQEVTAPGWPTPDEAFKSLPANMRAEIIDWETGFDEDIDIGGYETLALSQSRILLPALNQQVGNSFIKTITVNSSLPRWSYEISTSPDVVTGTVSWITSHSRTQNGAGNDDFLELTIEENPGTRREAYIHLQAGNLTEVLRITQRKLHYPNCYILKPGETIEIPVIKMWEVWTSDIMGSEQMTESSINNFFVSATPTVIWQEALDLIDFSLEKDTNEPKNSKIRITAGMETGNALLALEMLVSNTYWSWHIWVTDYDPDNQKGGTTYNYNNGYRDYLFMDRNLGATTTTPQTATTFGLHYQWGRKDPFPGANVTEDGGALTTHYPVYTGTSTTASENVINTVANTSISADNINKNTLYYSIRSPRNFITSSGAPNDWYTTQATYQNDYLWSEVDGSKGVFDPCPDGWRVPAMDNGLSPWAVNSSDNLWIPNPKQLPIGFYWNAGWTFPSSSYGGYYPGAGWRLGNQNPVAISGVGTCYNWTASPGKTSMFTKTNIFPVMPVTYSRTYAVSIRCVQDD